MKKILIAVVAGVLVGALAAQAKLPPQTDADKNAAAEKKAKEAADAKKASEVDIPKAQEKAVANYKRNAGATGKK